MANTQAAAVSEVLGWKQTDDGSNILLGFKQPDGNEFSLAISSEILMQVIMSLVHATESIPAPKGMNVQNALAMWTNWYEFGKDTNSGNYFVRFRIPEGGHLSFVMDHTMATGLLETMNAMILGVATPPPPGTHRN